MVDRRASNRTKQTIAGAGAGLVASIITCPLDVVKTRLQNQAVFKDSLSIDKISLDKHRLGFEQATKSQNNNRPINLNNVGIKQAKTTLYRGTLPSLRRIWYEEGLFGLYRGLTPTILGYLPTWAIYFTTYDYMKASLAYNLILAILITVLKYLTDIPESTTPVQVLGAMSAGATCTIATSPLWTQTDFTVYRYKGTLDAFRSILRDEGFKGFYKGLVPSLLGVSHVAVQFPLYEHLKTYFAAIDEDKVRMNSILLSSSLSKMIASCVTYPHEVIRTRLQNQSVKPYKYKGILDASRIILVEEGYKGFYRGLTTNLIRTVPASAFTLLTYELIIHKLPSW